MNKAILIPANPKLKEALGSEIGSILAHATHIEENGGVIWQLLAPGGWGGHRKMKFSSKIRTGYLYDVPSKKVTHKIDIEWIKNSQEISWADIRRYDQESRRKALYPTEPIFESERNKEHGSYISGHFFILIRNIFLLKTPHRLVDFNKVKDNAPITNVRNFAIVNEPNFAHYDRSITRADIMSDYIADLLIRSETVKERHVEDLFFLHLLKEQKLVKRQFSFKKGGRADLLFRDKKGAFWLYELKRDVATAETIGQINRYARQLSKQERIPYEKIHKVIIARDADPQLRLNAKKEGVLLWKYGFEVRTYPM